MRVLEWPTLGHPSDRADRKVTLPTPADVERYQRDGVLLLLDGVLRNAGSPGVMSRYHANEPDGDFFFYDTVNWARIEPYCRFVFDSPAAAIAGPAVVELVAVRGLRREQHDIPQQPLNPLRKIDPSMGIKNP